MRYVIALDVAMALAKHRGTVPAEHQLLAPALLRSQLLAALYRAVQTGALDRAEARARLEHIRSLKLRLLGDRVLQAVAWDVAEQPGWADTYTAEYVALTKLQADAFVTLDDVLARQVAAIVRVEPASVLMTST